MGAANSESAVSRGDDGLEVISGELTVASGGTQQRHGRFGGSGGHLCLVDGSTRPRSRKGSEVGPNRPQDRADRCGHRGNHVSDDPANPMGIARDRLAYTMMGLLPELPETMKISRMLAFNRGIAAGIRVPGMKLSNGDEVRQQCVPGANRAGTGADADISHGSVTYPIQKSRITRQGMRELGNGQAHVELWQWSTIRRRGWLRADRGARGYRCRVPTGSEARRWRERLVRLHRPFWAECPTTTTKRCKRAPGQRPAG